MEEKKTEEKRWCVYMHTSPSGKKYIGITSLTPVYKRWGKDGYGYRKNQYFWRAIQKYKWENFTHIIVEENLNFNDACELETDLIHRFNSNNSKYGYNILDYDISKHGHVVSDTIKEKIRCTLNGKYTGIKSKRSKIVYCIELQMCFVSAQAGANYVHITRCCITDCIKGRQKSAGRHPDTGEKLHWMYVKDAVEQGYITQEKLDNYIKDLKEKEKENDK